MGLLKYRFPHGRGSVMALQAAFVLIVFVSACFAQKESLLIGPGDQLHIQVFDTPEMEQTPRVTDAGMVPLLLVGDVKVAGMTPGDAAHEIEEVLKSKQLMLHPQVAITVLQYATQNVYVMGQVTNPGAYPITTPSSVVSVLALAGGLADVADRHITIERHSDPSQRVNYFLSNRSDEALNNDVLVYPGDTVLVPKVGIVYVLGDVGKPGGYPISTNDSQMTVLQALAIAGSANKTSVLSKARLIRKTANGTTDIPLQLAAIQNGKQADVPMEADDMLFVPFSWMKNIAIGSSGIATSAASAMIYAHP
jgi:polysaccharide biosynthesis/export protein